MSFFSTFVYFVIFTFSKHASAAKAVSNYCDFGFCESEQYCCGDNKCCDKLLDGWYFWLGLGIIIVVVSLIIFFKYYLKRRKPQNCKYKFLETS